jgi:hypothetical protein
MSRTVEHRLHGGEVIATFIFFLDESLRFFQDGATVEQPSANRFNPASRAIWPFVRLVFVRRIYGSSRSCLVACRLDQQAQRGCQFACSSIFLNTVSRRSSEFTHQMGQPLFEFAQLNVVNPRWLPCGSAQ